MQYAESQYTVDEILAGLPEVVGSGIPPKHVELNLATDNLFLWITWNPVRTYLNNILICEPGGVVIVIKEGSEPVDMDDGFFIHDYRGQEMWNHVETPVTLDTITVDKTYYIRAFTYSDQGVFNLTKNVKSIETKDSYVMGFKQVFNDLNPDTTIRYVNHNEKFLPVFSNVSAGEKTMGSWSVWPWLNRVRPYMVHPNGTSDYALDPNDYTKKLDGTPSDIENQAYDGGAFVWIPKLYTKENYSSTGESRRVQFSHNIPEGETDWIPRGFTKLVDGVETELEGIWLPMFYMSEVEGVYKTVGGGYPLNGTTIKTVIDAMNGEVHNGILLGGGFWTFIRDILYMLFKTTNIQANAGYGRGLYFDETQIPKNQVVGNGMFYGTAQLARTMNKIFHSIVLGSYIGEVCDPYAIEKNDTSANQKLWTIDDYRMTDIPNSGNYTLASRVYTENTIVFPTSLSLENNKIGSIPVVGGTGSSLTGLCDGYYGNSNGANTYYATRFGSNNEGESGPGFFRFRYQYEETLPFNVLFAQTFLPPVGYDPMSNS